jgi:threonine aldolase
MGASAANSGVQFTETGAGGVFTVDEFLAARNPRGHLIYPPTTLVEIENTQNRAGGVIFPQEEAERICGAARAEETASYPGCARSGMRRSRVDRRRLISPRRSTSFRLRFRRAWRSGGSLLAGPRALIDRAVRQRRMLGGAMRQVGIFAAAGLHALDHHYKRLVEDHANAQRIGSRLAQSHGSSSTWRRCRRTSSCSR